MRVLFLGLMFSLVLSVSSAFAGEFGDLKTKVNTARDTLITLLKHADKRGDDQQKLVKDTANAVSAMLSGMKAPAGKDAQFKVLSDNWNAFKKTREEELVPAILAGKQAEAEKIGLGIQKERLGKVLTMCDELNK